MKVYGVRRVAALTPRRIYGQSTTKTSYRNRETNVSTDYIPKIDMPRCQGNIWKHLEMILQSVEGSEGLYRSRNLERSEIAFDFQMINDPSSASRLMGIWNNLEFLNGPKSLRDAQNRPPNPSKFIFVTSPATNSELSLTT